jgi:AcrR family transcriptional regulator
MNSVTTQPAVSPRLDQIINATRALFVRYGYRRTSMDDIAREAGLAKATLYLHFSGKEDVFRAMVGRCREIIAERCDEAERLDAPAADRLAALLEAYFGTALEWFGDASHMAELKAFVAERSPKEGTESEAALHGRLRRMIAAGVEAGEFDVSRTGLVADEIVDVVMQAAVGAKHGHGLGVDGYGAALRNIAALTVAALAARA